jgi:hypothetical protein
MTLVGACVGSQPSDREGRTFCIEDAHGYGKRFVMRADEKLTAFVELERASRGCGFSRLDNLTRFFQTWRP